MNLGWRDALRDCIREKAGMDEATISGLRERVRSGLLSIKNRLMNHAGYITKKVLDKGKWVNRPSSWKGIFL